MTLEDKAQVLGILKEMNDLFAKQTEIIHKYTKKQVVMTEEDQEKLGNIEKGFRFLSLTLKENIGQNTVNQVIGRMLLDARKQAENIVAEAKTTTTVEAKEATTAVVESEKTEKPVTTESEKEEVTVAVLPEKAMEQTRNVHNKYIASLDSIVQEIDNFLADN